MSMRMLAQHLFQVEESLEHDGYWQVHYLLKDAARARLKLDPQDRVGRAALKTCVRREVFEAGVNHFGDDAEVRAALVALLDDARIELAEALGMTELGEFAVQGEHRCDHRPSDNPRYQRVCVKCGQVLP